MWLLLQVDVLFNNYIIYSVLIFTYRVGDDISHGNKFDKKAILELISSLYEEEDDMIV